MNIYIIVATIYFSGKNFPALDTVFTDDKKYKYILKKQLW